ncbi:MAG TPA: MotA/TolQ/ExbB proton channel family protein [Fibrobacteria bacterium]|nr:MotA/TolQ/ExbB proton channel family protein [Fibrobacteria bacterium]
MFSVIYETWQQGGIVLIPILLVGFWGFCLVLGTYVELGAGLWRTNLNPLFERVRGHLAQGEVEAAKDLAGGAPQLVGYGLSLALDNRGLPEDALRRLLSEKLALSLFSLERHLPLVRVMAASAPLLGLLGTVSGLIHTFQVMTEYGNGNAVLLAHGISEALIATQSGLLLAIVLILLGQRLEGRVHWLQNQVEYGVTMMLNQIYHPKEGGS